MSDDDDFVYKGDVNDDSKDMDDYFVYKGSTNNDSSHMNDVDDSNALEMSRNHEDYYDEIDYSRKKQPSIANIDEDIKNIKIPDNIKLIALEIFKEMGSPSHKGNRRKQIILSCINQAYLHEGYIFDISHIIEITGIKATGAIKCSTFANKKKSNYNPVSIIQKPQYFVKAHMEAVGLDISCLDELMKLADNILDKEDRLYDEKPQFVSAAIVQYFMVINGIEFDKTILPNAISRSQSTLNAIYNKVLAADNK